MTQTEPSGARGLDPPPGVIDIATTLERAGFETWCVGGAVRDALLGHRHLDWDLATAATPPELRRLFRRTVPLGVEFGTVGVFDRSGVMHEVTTFRRDVRTDGRHAVVEFGATLDEDLARRDFTINAIAYSPTRAQLHDPFGGRADLERGVVRAVGDPDARMREDRLRALRAMRFAARFGFALDAATWRAVVASTPHLGRLSAERVKEELRKTMEQVERPSRAIALWKESGALAALVPGLAALSDVGVASLDQLPRARMATEAHRTLDRLVALFAELAPPEAGQTLRALRFSNREAASVTAVVEGWTAVRDSLEAALASGLPVADAQIRRWVAAVGRLNVRSVLRLAHARAAARRALGLPAPSAARVASLYRRSTRSAFRDAVAVSDLAVDGDDLRAIGIPEGPAIGRILQALLDAVLEDPSVNTRDALLAQARKLYDSGTV